MTGRIFAERFDALANRGAGEGRRVLQAQSADIGFEQFVEPLYSALLELRGVQFLEPLGFNVDLRKSQIRHLIEGLLILYALPDIISALIASGTKLPDLPKQDQIVDGRVDVSNEVEVIQDSLDRWVAFILPSLRYRQGRLFFGLAAFLLFSERQGLRFLEIGDGDLSYETDTIEVAGIPLDLDIGEVVYDAFRRRIRDRSTLFRPGSSLRDSLVSVGVIRELQDAIESLTVIPRAWSVLFSKLSSLRFHEKEPPVFHVGSPHIELLSARASEIADVMGEVPRIKNVLSSLESFTSFLESGGEVGDCAMGRPRWDYWGVDYEADVRRLNKKPTSSVLAVLVFRLPADRAARRRVERHLNSYCRQLSSSEVAGLARAIRTLPALPHPLFRGLAE
ncbi:MAG: hypothetical protein ACFHX7_21995 [Pseudomonadota bacterium]